MNLKLQFLIIILLLFSLSCNEKSVTPPDEEKPPGYQEDIPWPSLADSPWPMFRADPQNSGRSKADGPSLGIIEWQIDSVTVVTETAIDKNDNIYFTSKDLNRGLMNLAYNGSLKFKYSFNLFSAYTPANPIITNDGTIYTSSPSDKLFLAINPDGTLKWKIENVLVTTTGCSVGKDGTIYFLDNLFSIPNLYAVSPSGNIQWTLYNLRIYSGEYSSIGCSPDSKTLYFHGPSNNSLTAVDVDNQSIKWTYKSDYAITYPLIDSYGNIYIVTLDSNKTKCTLHSINEKGETNWTFNIDEDWIEGCAMDKYGNIYLGHHYFYSINNKGELNWKKQMSVVNAPASIDDNSNIYVPVNSSAGAGIELIKLNREGSIIWSVPVPFDNHPGYSFGLGNDRIYVYDSWSTLVSIK